MIGRLKRKFIFINMVLVAAVLLIVFTVICVSNYQQQRRASDGAMRMALMRDVGMPIERFRVGPEKPPEKPASLLPLFSVTLTEDGGIQMLDTGNVDVSDEVVASAIQTVLESGADEGHLPALGLRYMRDDTPHGHRIVFLDTSMEQTTMTRLILTLAMVGLGGLAAFFGISVFLANWALRPVETVWAQQQQFVADASHELKTPLTIILANLGILKGHGNETIRSQDKWIENTRLEATRMKKLVDDLLFLAKADSAEAPVEKASFSLTDLLWRCSLSFEPVAYELGLTLSTDIATDINIIGNEAQFVQLATILMDNACKYAGPQGAVSLTLTRAQDSAVIAVHNTGEPIPADELQHVFERFYRTDKARTRTQGGYGLGLAIAERIVSVHGGKLAAMSDAANGTTFSATFHIQPEMNTQSRG